MAELNCGTERSCADCLVGTLPSGEVRSEVLCALSAIAGTHLRTGTNEMFARATDVDEAWQRAHSVLTSVIDDDEYVTGDQKRAIDIAVPHIVSGECISE